jgi:DNA-binding MarR family transcriptional regulator
MPEHGNVTSSPVPAQRGRAATGAVADSVLDLLRTVRKAKARMAADARGDVESATQLLLLTVAAHGPVRTSALAASVHSDLSTVSRQVGALVAGGLLERRADPADGRACLLALTPAGEAAVADHEQRRADFFAAVLDGWAQDELLQFAGLLDRFTASYDHVHAAWIAERAAQRSAQATPTEGTHA